VDGNFEIFISDCEFKNISSTGSGSCINTKKTKELNIISSDFEDINSTLDGGSIYFGEGSLKLSISSSMFTSCSSLNGNGGAIGYGSRSGTYLLIEEACFVENNVGSWKRGNDYCDVVKDNSSFPLYNCESLISISSTSESDKFFHISADFSFDFYLSDICDLGYSLIFTDINSGRDDINCGGYLSRCKTFEYGINNIIANPKMIILNGGTYDFSYVSMNNKNVYVEGMRNQYLGSIDEEDIATYPKIIGYSENNINDGRIFYVDNSEVTFEYIQILLSPTSYSSLTFFCRFFFFS
jgi:hypothetical protein